MLTIKLQGNRMTMNADQGLILDMEELEKDDEISVVLKGKLVSETSHPIQDELEAFVSVGKRITIDCKEVTYISAAVMTVLLNAQMLADNYFGDSEIVLKGISRPIYNILCEHGVSDQLVIEE